MWYMTFLTSTLLTTSAILNFITFRVTKVGEQRASERAILKVLTVELPRVAACIDTKLLTYKSEFAEGLNTHTHSHYNPNLSEHEMLRQC
jgi:hypothetical protein